MADAPSYQVLAIGIDDRAEKFLRSCLTVGGELQKISTVQEFEAQFETWQDGIFAGVFCGSKIPELNGNELAQAVQNQCPKMHKYFMTYEINEFQPTLLIKNGFMAAFLLPQDAELVKVVMREEIVLNMSERKALRAVKLFDLGSNEQLEFKTFVFLPLNNKFIPFSAEKQPIEEGRLKKLNQHQVGNLFIDKKDMDKFYTYSANRLRDLTGDKSKIGSTERQDKLQNHVRNLMASIFDQSIKTDFAGAKEMLENCQSIISNFVTKGGSNDWYQRLLASVGDQKDPYNHAGRVSTFAALFALGIGHPSPEDLAMAGVFHDLGMVDMTEEVMTKPQSEWTPEERTLYESHPDRSISYLKAKRISVPEKVEKAITQHHERMDGKGFPKKIPGGRLLEEGQILSYADQFDYLTRIEPGKKQLTPLEAHQAIVKTQSIGVDLLGRIARVLNQNVEAQKKSG